MATSIHSLSSQITIGNACFKDEAYSNRSSPLLTPSFFNTLKAHNPITPAIPSSVFNHLLPYRTRTSSSPSANASKANAPSQTYLFGFSEPERTSQTSQTTTSTRALSENNEADGEVWDEENETKSQARKRRNAVFELKNRKAVAGEKDEEEENVNAAYRFYKNKKYYIDELDVLSILENHVYLRPLDPVNYNAAEYIWKKIDDIPEERRIRLLEILEPRHLSKLWKLSALKYQNPDENFDFDASIFLDANFFLPDSMQNDALKPEIWEGLVFGLPPPFQFLQRFQKAFFIGNDGLRYGRVISGGPIFESLSNVITPLYFSVRTEKEVLATGENCETSFQYGDGQLHLKQAGLPLDFPTPKPHPFLFNNGMCDYVRAIASNVLIGQTWQEGKDLENVPKKFLQEFILIKKTL